MNHVHVRSPQGDMFKLVGEWHGETVGQDFNGRGRMLVWLEPIGPMSRVEPEESPSHYPDSPSQIRKAEGRAVAKALDDSLRQLPERT